MRIALTLASILIAAGCNKQAPAKKTSPTDEAAATKAAEKPEEAAEKPENAAKKQPVPTAPAAKKAEAGPAKAASNANLAKAVVGQPAPDFELPGVDGKNVRLSSLRGKVVVLEWYNPDCPFVKWAHNEGPLRDMAARYTAKDVTWLAINSGAPGKQGNGLQRNKASLAEYKLSHPILLDEPGHVGKAYGVTNTPQLYVVGKDGVLLYAGGLDNLPFGEMAGQGEPRKHCEEALTDVLSGKPVRVPKTKPWGCTVKYAS